MGCSTSQVRLTAGLLLLRDVQLLPQTLKHSTNARWQLSKHVVWAILIFGMGVKLPAKLVVIEDKRIIATALSFICALKKHSKFAPQLNEQASRNRMPIPVPLQGSPFFCHLAGSTEGNKEINGVRRSSA